MLDVYPYYSLSCSLTILSLLPGAGSAVLYLAFTWILGIGLKSLCLHVLSSSTTEPLLWLGCLVVMVIVVVVVLELFFSPL